MSSFLEGIKKLKELKKNPKKDVISPDKDIKKLTKKIKKKVAFIEEKPIKIEKNHPKKKIKVLKKKKLDEKSSQYKPSPLVIVKKELSENLDDARVKEWVSRVDGFIEGTTKNVEDKPTRLYDYQIAHMRNKSKFRAIEKARQTGFSYAFSAESLGKSQLCNINTSIFISYNQEEADEKILNCKQLYESMPSAFQKKRITDNKHSQVFRNNKGQQTRIISTAQRPPRGKGYNTDVYLDEFAFFMFADRIFVASVPVITRGTGQFTMASTPFGARGKYWDIVSHPQTYSEFSRQRVPWWHCPDLCTDIVKAFKEASQMSTRDRIRKFGEKTIRVIYESMPEDDFQQEYELAYIDENVSYYPLKLINGCCYPINIEDYSLDEIMDVKGSKIVFNKKDKFPIELKYPNMKFFKCESIEELAGRIVANEISPNLLAGYDVGRRKDKSELTVIEEIDLGEQTFQSTRLTLQFDRVSFETQKQALRKLLLSTPVRKMGIDEQGIGMNIAEDLETEFTDRVEKVSMTTNWKDEAAQSLKIRMENQLLAIPDDENLKKQIQSIKKKVSDTGAVRYDAERDKEHHGDKFWSLALASRQGVDPSKMQKLNTKVIAASNRLLISQPNPTELPGVLSSNIGVFNNIPGIGSLPPLIEELVSTGNFIDLGSSKWMDMFNGSRIRTPKK